jgi:hypothetical protein
VDTPTSTADVASGRERQGANGKTDRLPIVTHELDLEHFFDSSSLTG